MLVRFCQGFRVISILTIWCALATIVSAEDARGGYVLRAAYIVPADRQPIPDFARKTARVLGWVQKFYADQMEVHGLGRRTFTLKREPIHLIRSSLTALDFAGEGHMKYATGSYWTHSEEALKQAGFTPYQRREIWIVFVEAQDQLPDGSIRNGTNQGSGGFESGMCVNSSTVLSLSTPKNLHDLRRYNGLILPEIGPYPLQEHKSFPAYEGDFVSSLAGDFLSALAHEIGHCFGLAHCYLNDETLNGNLMGNGFRGWRGYFMPAQCPHEDTRLDRPSAIALNLSPFFQKSVHLAVKGNAPVVQITTPPGDMKLVNGCLELSFNASSNEGGIALATLDNGSGRDNVGLVAWREFSDHPLQVHATIETSRINPGREDTWRLTVIDVAGNRTETTLVLKAPDQGFAPTPNIVVDHTRVLRGSVIEFHVRDRQNATYKWSFSDGSSAIGVSALRIFSKLGTYEVSLTATAVGGNSATTSQFIYVSARG